MATFDLTDPLDFNTITSLFLYGTKKPPEIFDRIREANAESVSVNVDATKFMDKNSGPGRYFFPALARPKAGFFRDFFEAVGAGSFSTMPQALQQLFAAQNNSGIVTVTAQWLFDNAVNPQTNKRIDLISTNAFFTDQAGWEPNTDDYAARTYIYGHENFHLDPNTTFVFNLDDPKQSEVQDLKIIPDADNFDFTTTGLAQLGNDLFLQPNVDPYHLNQVNPGQGTPVDRPVDITFTNTEGIESQTYTHDQYVADKRLADQFDDSILTLASRTLPAMAGLVNKLDDAKITEYEKEGRPIIFGTARDDKLTLNSFVHRPSVFEVISEMGGNGPPMVLPPSQAIFVGGPGDDTIIGGNGNDVMYGGTGDDTLIAGPGEDYLDGGAGTNTAVFNFGGTIDLSTGQGPPNGFNADGDGAFVNAVHGGKTDILHAIQKIDLTGSTETVLRIDSLDPLKGTNAIQQVDGVNAKKSTLDLTEVNQPKGTLVYNQDHIEGTTTIFKNFQVIGADPGAVDMILGGENDGSLETLNFGDGNDTVQSSVVGLTVNFGDGNDTLAAGGVGSVVNAGAGHDVFDVGNSNDVLVSGATTTDSFLLYGVRQLTGASGWIGQQDPWTTNPLDGVSYGIDPAGELQIKVGDNIMFVGGYGAHQSFVPQNNIGSILLVDRSFSASLLLKLPDGIPWLLTQFQFVNAESKADLGQVIYGGVDPLVFDLSGAGINLTAPSGTSPMLDMNNNGFKVHSGWIEANEGVLVLDKNGSGQVESAVEMFGGSGQNAVAALAKYDSNLDGVIDAKDSIYSQLRIWVDTNDDGVVDPGELLTLQQAGIASINLGAAAQAHDFIAGNQVLATGSFTRTDGSIGAVDAVSFATDNFDSQFRGSTAVSATASTLPNLKGYGTLTDLQVAMTNDPALMSVVQATMPNVTALGLADLRNEVMPILTAWAKAVQGIDNNGNPIPIPATSHADVPILVSDNSGGSTPSTVDTSLTLNVTDFAYEVTDGQGSYWKLASGNSVLDAQGNPIKRPTLDQVMAQTPSGAQWMTFSGAQLDFLERYLGNPIPLGTMAPQDPAGALANISATLNTYKETLDQLSVRLAMQGPLAPYFAGVAYSAATDKFTPTTDQQLTPMYEAIFRAAPQNAAGAAAWLGEWRQIIDVMLGDFQESAGSHIQLTFGYEFASMVRAFETVGLPLDIVSAAEALGVPAGMVFVGGATVTGNNSGDIFYLGNGDQTVIGSTGGDNFVLGGHFGHDVIYDDQRFGGPENPAQLYLTGLKPTDVTAFRNGNDLILDDAATGQQVTITNEFIGLHPALIFGNTNDVWGVAEIIFSDGTVWNKDDMAAAVAPNTNGVDGTLLGTSSNDVLDGGRGNHFMSGGDGGDTYLYGRGDGNDTIFDNAGDPFNNAPDIVKFGPGITESDLTLSRNGNPNDLLITIDGDPSDSLLIQGQFAAAFTGPFGVQFFDQIEAFTFADGSFLTFEDVRNQVLAQEEATPGAAILGFDAIDNTLDPGVGGNRFMSGGNNSDTYVFGLGYGNDTIKGGHGNILSSGNQDPSTLGTNLAKVTAVRDPGTGSLTLTLADGSTLVVQGPLVDGNDSLVSSDATAPSKGQVVSPFGSSDATLVLSDGAGMVTFSARAISGGGQTVLFGQGVDPSQVQVVRNADSGDVTFVLSDGSALTVENQFVNASFLNIWLDRIDNFQFQDAAGTRWSVDDVMNKAIARQESVPGGAIYGFQRGDTIDPGLGGNRFMSGKGGPDVYIFGQGYGHDTLFENGGLFASNGTEVLFKPDVDPSTIRFARNGASNDLEILLGDGSELDIQGEFDPTRTFGPHFLDRIWTFQFQDPAQTSFSYLDLEHKLIAQEEAVAGGTVYDFAFGNGLAPGQGNTLDGFAGNETLVGAEGSFTTFVFGRGYGHEVVDGGPAADPFLSNFNILQVGAGITADQITFARRDGDVTLGIAGTSDTVTIRNQFDGISGNPGLNPIMQFNFAGGTSWDLPTFEQKLLASEEATAGSQVIGYGGNEVLQSGAPGQTLIGSDGGTITLIGSGSGTLIGGNGTDTLIGAGGDTLIGGSGADTLIGAAGDLLIGGDGRGAPSGFLLPGNGDGSDLFYGAAGDIMVGNSTADTFVMGAGSETVVEQDLGTAKDVLQFAAGVTPDQVQLSFSDGINVNIGVAGTADVLTIDYNFATSGNLSFAFAGGTSWNAAQFRQQLIADQQTEPDQTILGTQSGMTLDGAGGNAFVQAEADGETFVFGQGYGHEIINQEDRGGHSVLLIKDGILPTDVQVAQDIFGALVLSIPGLSTSDRLSVVGYFAASSDQLSAIEFADGTSWSVSTVESMATRLVGTGASGEVLESANSGITLDGGANNDLLVGGANDTYVFGRGYGHEVVEPLGGGSQVLQFKDDVSPSDVTVTADAQGDFIFSIAGTSDQVRVTSGGFQSPPSLTSVQFGTTSWDISTIEMKELQGGPGDTALIDYTGNNTLDLGPGSGDRVLVGNGAGDTYVFGRGYGREKIFNIDGAVPFHPGSGTAVLDLNADVSPADVTVSSDIAGDLILSIAGTADQAIVTNYFLTAYTSTPLASINFTDGTSTTSWNYSTVLALELTPAPGKDLLLSDRNGATVDGQGISHTYVSSGGNDTFVMDRGYGQVTIDNLAQNSQSTLLFNSDVAPADVTVTSDLRGDFIFSIAGTNDAATVQAPRNLAAVAFAVDGTSWNLPTVQAMELADAPAGGFIVDVFGGNTLDGRAGNDTLIGQGSSETYVFGRGYGHEVVLNEANGNATLDINAAAGDVVASMDAKGGLILSIAGTTDQVTALDYFGPLPLAAIDFSDGTAWSRAAALAAALAPAPGKDTIVDASGGGNTLDGAGVSHTLLGSGDTYVFGHGYGQNVIEDNLFGQTLVFKAGILQADVVLSIDQQGNYVFSLKGTADAVTVVRPEHLATVKFADGTTLTASSFHPPINPPTLAVQAASGNAATAIPLGISAALGDSGRGETLSVTIRGLPAGASLSAGTSNSDGSWTLTPAELAGLTLATPLNTSGRFTLSVTATETNLGGALAASATLALAVAAVASPPTLTVQPAEGLSGLAIPLAIATAITDPDGQESLAVTVAGLPSGVVLSAGTENADGSWTLTPAQLAGLTVTAPDSVSGTFALTITATATEGSDGSTASTTVSLSLTLDAPVQSTSQDGAVLQVGAGDWTLTGSGAGDTLIAGSGSDTLIGAGSDDVLVADSFDQSSGGVDTLLASGTGDTLVGNAGGDTLVSTGSQTVASYGLDNLAVDLTTGRAMVNGSSTADMLFAVKNIAVSGRNDTVIAGSGPVTLSSSGAANTLIAGSGPDILSSSGSGDTLLGGGGADTLSSSGSSNTLVAGGGSDILSTSGSGDTLLGGAGSDTLSSTGSGNALIAGSAAATLSSTGSGDTLIGNADGSTLEASAGSGAIAGYALDNVAVNLAAGTAGVTGSSVSDTLIGITVAAAYGQNDTLIGAGNADTLIGNAAGSTLTGGYAAYFLDNVTVSLASGTAAVNGTSASTSAQGDTLIGITAATVAGTGDTLLAGSGAETLFSSGSTDTLIAGAGADVLVSAGSSNTLVAGSGIDTLSSFGSGDTLFGNAAGSTLNGTNGAGAVAAYGLNNLTVNLAAGTAAVNGASVGDTLLGIATAAAFGQGDTLIGSNAPTTLISDAGGNTLISGTGSTTAAYALDHVTVDLGAGRASVNGASPSTSVQGDTLVGITAAAVFGGSDTLLAGSGPEILSSGGTNNTLIAGSGVDTLSSSGTGDTLVGNAAGSTLDGSKGSGTVAAYGLDNATVDLAAGSAGVNGGTAGDTLTGITAAMVSGSSDTLIGDANGDRLSATGSNDTVIGGTGDDTFFVNGGSDTFIGGGGSDDFIVRSAAIISGLNQPQNLIDGFDPINDTIDLTNLGPLTSFADLGFSTLSFGALSYLQVGLGASQALTLAGVTADQLSTGNFLFHAVTAPTLSVQAASGEAATAIPLDIASALADVATNESLSVNVAGLPTGTTLSAGTQNSDGSWTLTAAQLAGLTLTTPFTTFGDFSLAVAATATALDGVTQATTSGSIGLSVEARPQPPVLAVQNAQGNAGSAIPLVIDTAVLDHDRPETLSLTITDLPAGTTLSAGTQNPDGSWTLTPAQLSGLTLTAPAGLSGTFEPVVTSTATLTTDGLQAQSSANFALVLRSPNIVESTSGVGVVLQGGTGNDTLSASGSSDTLVAGTGTETLLSSGSGNTLLAGSGVNRLATSGAHDMLIAGAGVASLSSSGSGNVLTAGGGNATLATSGTADTLVSNAGGNTLMSTGTGTVAAYAVNDVTVALATGTASVNGTSVADTLTGIADVLLSGAGDTLTTADGGSYVVTATGASDVVGIGTPFIMFGPVTSDTLTASGDGDTLTGDSSSFADNTLMASGNNDVLIAGGGTNSLVASGGNDTLMQDFFGNISFTSETALGNNDTLYATFGANLLSASGTGDVLVAINGGGAPTNDTLVATGSGDTLVAGSGQDTVIASGSNDTLMGNGASAAGNTLIATGSGDVLLAAYDPGAIDTLIASGDNEVAVASPFPGPADARTADVMIASGNHDTLAVGLGNDTLIATGSNAVLFGNVPFVTGPGFGARGDTLVSNAAGNTLIAAGGADGLFADSNSSELLYTTANTTVDLAAGTASINGAAVGDTLVDSFAVAAVAGTADTLIAGGGDDTLTASGSGDTVIGGAGLDTLLGTGSAETLVSGSSFQGNFTTNHPVVANTLTAVGDNDTLFAAAGSDVLTATGTGDTLIGGDGSAILFGISAPQTLTASGDSDLLIAGTLHGDQRVLAAAGNRDTLLGGVGADTVVATGNNDVLTTGLDAVGGEDTLIALGNDDTLTGDRGAALFSATGTGNTLVAGIGNTTLVASGTGNLLLGDVNGTLISSGAGNTLVSGTGSETLTTSGNQDTLIANAASSLMASGTGDTLIGGFALATLPSGDNLLLSTGAGNVLISESDAFDPNTLVASAQNDTLFGGAGRDTLIATAAEDTLIASAAASHQTLEVLGGSGNTLIGSTGFDQLFVTNGSQNLLVGAAAAWQMTASGGSNTLDGTRGGGVMSVSGGNNTIIGNGNETLDYSGASSAVFVDLATHVTGGAAAGDVFSGIEDVSGSAGGSTLLGDAGNNVLIAGGGDSTLIGGGGDDVLIGGSGNGTLIGGSGDDKLFGGTGPTTLIGGGGNNNLFGNAVTVADYSGAPQAVKVDLTNGFAANNGYGGSDSFFDIQNVEATGAGNTLLGGTANDMLSVSGSDNTLAGGTGTETLIASGGSGNTLAAGTGSDTLVDGGTGDFYAFGGSGNATIVNGGPSNASAANELDIGGSLSDQQLWFLQSSNDLQIDVMGTKSEITVAGWFSSAGNQLQEITAAGMKLDSQVSQLVQAMATYAANNTGFDPTAVAQAPNDPNLQNAIAAAWHH